jgi:hypothetical protein
MAAMRDRMATRAAMEAGFTAVRVGSRTEATCVHAFNGMTCVDSTIGFVPKG